MAEQTKLMRTKLAHFLKTNKSAPAVWSRIGKGVTGYTQAMNPSVTTEQYINEDNATNSVDSYAVNAPIPLTCFVGEPVFEFLYGLWKKNAIGTELETEILDVSMFDEVGPGQDKFFAKKSTVVIQLDDFGGDAGAGAVMNGTILYNGDPVTGIVTITDGKPVFTPDVTA